MTFSLITDLLSEDRKKNRTYSEKFDKKDVNKLIEVTTNFDIEAVGGKKWREAAIGYLDLQMLRDDVSKTLEKANDQLRTDIENMFDETDKFATRVIKVGDIVLKLAKESVPEAKEEVDWEKIVAAVAEISDEMKSKVEELKKQFTTIKPPAPAKKAAVRVADNTPGSIAESIGSVISNGIKKFVKTFQSWFASIDIKIEKLESMVKKLT